MSAAADHLSAALADRYRIERELGAGGMATVYLAHDLKHDRKVALKVLKPELAAVIGGARFLSEIKTTANLQHPHILPLHDSGEVDGTVFYVMPFVDGESLRDRLAREKQLPISDAIRIAHEVADALHYAHQHGVIHRDIKPENILLHGGHALVADFGIALAASSTAGTRMTETGMSLGTPHYMSPEQAMGERDITARSDVYALGCVLYEMLLGEPPFTGPTAQSIVAKVLSERPASLRLRRDKIPPGVEVAVLTALEKLPADRFGSLAEFAAALDAPTAGVHPSSAAVSKPWWRDARVAVVALLSIAVGAVASALWLPRGTTPVSAAPALSSQLTFNGRSVKPGVSPDGEFVAFVELRCPLTKEVGCLQSLVVQSRANGKPVELLRDVPGVETPRWTADGQSVVVSARLDSLRVGLFVIPRLGGVPRLVGGAPDAFDTHATAADSLVVIRRNPKTGEQVAYFISLASGGSGDSAVLGKREVTSVGWSPNGRQLAVVQSYAGISIFQRDGSLSDSLVGPFRATIRWTPDGSGVLIFRALAVKEDDFQKIPVSSRGTLGKPEVILQKVSAALRGDFDVARHDGRLAFVSGTVSMDYWTFALPPGPPAPRQRLAGTTWYGHPAITPDGTQLYYVRGDALGDNFYLLRLPDEEEALGAGKLPGGTSNVQVSRDQRRALFSHTDSGGIVLSDFDIASRQTKTFAWSFGDLSVTPIPVGARGFVYESLSGRAILQIDSVGGKERALAIPDSVTVERFDLSPNGLDIAVILSTESGRRVGVTPLANWQFRELQRATTGKHFVAIKWADDGWIYVASDNVIDQSAELARIRHDGGPFTFLMTLPSNCIARTINVAARAPVGVCQGNDTRGDVWFADLPQLKR